MKTKKVVATIIILMTVAYGIVLSFLSEVPIEKKIVVLVHEWSFQIPFGVSYWWNLFVFPFCFVMIMYAMNFQKVFGKEPNSAYAEICSKYQARLILSMTDFLTLMFSSLIGITGSFVGLFTVDQFGPLSTVATMLVFFIVFRFMVGPAMLFLWFLFNVSSEEESPFKRYEIKFLAFLKHGFLISIPYLISLSAAFFIRFSIGGVIKGLDLMWKNIWSEAYLDD